MSAIFECNKLQEHVSGSLSVIIRISQPQDLPVLINATPKQLLDDLPV
jgi:hypothetical protein